MDRYLKRFVWAVVVLVLAWVPALAQSLTPRAGGGPTAITIGGTAVTIITGPMNGCYIFNPLNASDQNIITAETLYVDPTGVAAVNSSNGTSAPLAPGQPWFCIPFSTKSVSVNAVTSGHAFTVVRW